MSDSSNNSMETVSFRRFLSYIYAYEDDTKLRNVGFAKVEVRSQRVRFQVTVNGIFQKGGRPLELCLVDGNLNRIPVGQVMLQNGRGEYRGSSNTEDLWDSGISFSQIYGICLQGAGNRRHYYMTLWREVPRPARVSHNQIVVIPRNREQEDIAGQTQKDDVGQTIQAAEVKDEQEEAEAKSSVQGECSVGGFDGGSAVESGRGSAGESGRGSAGELAEGSAGELNRGSAVELGRGLAGESGRGSAGELAEGSAGELAEGSAGELVEGLAGNLDEGLTEEKPEDRKEASFVVETSIEVEMAEREMEEKETAEKKIVEEELQEQLESASELIRQQSAAEISDTKISDMEISDTKISNMGTQEMKYQQNRRIKKEDKRMELWKRFCSRYPHVDIRPDSGEDWNPGGGFSEAGKICEVLRIRPNDIGRLPRNNWILVHNSFLQHAYNHSHQLILFRVEKRAPEAAGESQWFIGLPGEKSEQETLVAEVFGFKKFLKCKNGGFWYTEIYMGVY